MISGNVLLKHVTNISYVYENLTNELNVLTCTNSHIRTIRSITPILRITVVFQPEGPESRTEMVG